MNHGAGDFFAARPRGLFVCRLTNRFHLSVAAFWRVACGLLAVFTLSYLSRAAFAQELDSKEAITRAIDGAHSEVHSLYIRMKRVDERAAQWKTVIATTGSAGLIDGIEEFAFDKEKRFHRVDFTTRLAPLSEIPQVADRVAKDIAKGDSHWQTPNGEPFRNATTHIYDGEKIWFAREPAKNSNSFAHLTPPEGQQGHSPAGVETNFFTDIGWFVNNPLAPPSENILHKRDFLPDVIASGSYRFAPLAEPHRSLVRLVGNVEGAVEPMQDELQLDPKYGYMLRKRLITEATTHRLHSRVECDGEVALTQHAFLPRLVRLEWFEQTTAAVNADQKPILTTTYTVLEAKANDVDPSLFAIRPQPRQEIIDYVEAKERGLKGPVQNGTNGSPKRRWLLGL
jgi:hypothetical protein